MKIIPPHDFNKKEYCESTMNVFQLQKGNIDVISESIKQLATSVYYLIIFRSKINRSNTTHAKDL